MDLKQLAADILNIALLAGWFSPFTVLPLWTLLKGLNIERLHSMAANKLNLICQYCVFKGRENLFVGSYLYKSYLSYCQ